ncbi:TPA: hypothetical protein ENX78_17865 [Candidatus Poribacteria bacterium]|nr:hypothetical protein [Candidatus Poribacteria bacterium]
MIEKRLTSPNRYLPDLTDIGKKLVYIGRDLHLPLASPPKELLACEPPVMSPQQTRQTLHRFTSDIEIDLTDKVIASLEELIGMRVFKKRDLKIPNLHEERLIEPFGNNYLPRVKQIVALLPAYLNQLPIGDNFEYMENSHEKRSQFITAVWSSGESELIKIFNQVYHDNNQFRSRNKMGASLTLMELLAENCQKSGQHDLAQYITERYNPLFSRVSGKKVDEGLGYNQVKGYAEKIELVWDIEDAIIDILRLLA